VVLRYENKSLVEILAPGARKLFWKWGAPQSFEVIDIKENYVVDAKLISYLAQPTLRGKAIAGLQNILPVVVPESHVGLLKVDGKLVGLLKSGKTAYWRFNRDIQVELVDTRLQALEVAGQEILTSDKVSLRINLNANWQYDDVEVAYARLAKPAEYIYRELQFGLRAAVGTRSLDELLENKQIIDQVVNQHLQEKLQGFGLRVLSLGVKDIVLPGEMKVLLAQVVEAEKAAQANVIRRREETSATRSMLNTARVMENNPTALRLKELETLEKIAERIDKISVFGGLDQVLNGLVKINP
jgi:regulator of protease activity HflC (stomatin/prohibitin superfamily)